MSDIFQ